LGVTVEVGEGMGVEVGGSVEAGSTDLPDAQLEKSKLTRKKDKNKDCVADFVDFRRICILFLLL